VPSQRPMGEGLPNPVPLDIQQMSLDPPAFEVTQCLRTHSRITHFPLGVRGDAPILDAQVIQCFRSSRAHLRQAVELLQRRRRGLQLADLHLVVGLIRRVGDNVQPPEQS
jgi:hypothetical protein